MPGPSRDPSWPCSHPAALLVTKCDVPIGLTALSLGGRLLGERMTQSVSQQIDKYNSSYSHLPSTVPSVKWGEDTLPV